MKTLTPLALRRAGEAAQQTRFLETLQKTKQIENAQPVTRTKRLDASTLSQYIVLPLNSSRALKSSDTFRTRSYNQQRQVIELIDHLFVRYRVPFFLYRAVLNSKGMKMLFDIKTSKSDNSNPETRYLSWFLTVAQGGSLAKLTQGVLTKKETHFFLQAPDSLSIDEACRWAKYMVAGIGPEGSSYLIEGLAAEDEALLEDRLPDFLRLFNLLIVELRKTERAEVMDYLRAMIRFRDFSFKGRTPGSIRKLTHAWHRTAYDRVSGPYMSWKETFPAWEHKSRQMLVYGVELTNNRLLSAEGRRQRHCVVLYASRCEAKVCAIYSLRAFHGHEGVMLDPAEMWRLTLEVNLREREVVQIRGRHNRRATADEMKIVRHWAGTAGLKVSAWA